MKWETGSACWTMALGPTLCSGFRYGPFFYFPERSDPKTPGAGTPESEVTRRLDSAFLPDASSLDRLPDCGSTLHKAEIAHIGTKADEWMEQEGFQERGKHEFQIAATPPSPTDSMQSMVKTKYDEGHEL